MKTRSEKKWSGLNIHKRGESCHFSLHCHTIYCHSWWIKIWFRTFLCHFGEASFTAISSKQKICSSANFLNLFIYFTHNCHPNRPISPNCCTRFLMCSHLKGIRATHGPLCWQIVSVPPTYGDLKVRPLKLPVIILFKFLTQHRTLHSVQLRQNRKHHCE